jgi:pantoate--beta-alanine ligase
MTKIIHTPQDLIAQVAVWRAAKARIGLVPTMGALHAGHLSLIAQARESAEKVIVSIFVNPTQFGPDEDFDQYPRHETRDIAKLTAMNVDAIYLPKVNSMYPEGFATSVHVTGISEGLCGAHRRSHFDGVATVVTKLLLQAMPDIAIFGEKDYQQLQVIKRVVADLNIPIKILSGATMREDDGLALSSRNQYLSADERKIAPLLQAMLQETAIKIQAEPLQVAALLQAGREKLIVSGFEFVDYMELCDAGNLQPLQIWNQPARLLAAAYLGKTRLIDNIAVG